MKCFVSHTLDGIGSLVIEDRPAPGPIGPGQVRVAMRAASINYRDLLVIDGTFPQFTLPDLIPCSDGAGEVIETAADVWRVRPGDRVALTFNPDWIGGSWSYSPGAPGRGGAVQGVMREEMVVGQHELVVLPPHLDFAEGAALPCAAVTAWHALCGPAPLLPGMTVLLQGAGGVSLFALQFARMFGARVIVTSSSPARCAALRAHGADETIDYVQYPDWHQEVRRLTGGRGVDVTVELGGAGTLERSIAATAIGGRVALVGRLTGPSSEAVGAPLGAIDTHTIKVGSRDDFEALVRAMAFHGTRPVIDSRHRFEDLPAALRLMRSGRHFGKIVLEFG